MFFLNAEKSFCHFVSGGGAVALAEAVVEHCGEDDLGEVVGGFEKVTL